MRLTVKLFAVSFLLAASFTDAGGLLPVCDSSVNAQEAPSACGLQPSRKIDEYADLGAGEEQARLDKWMTMLEGEPEDTKGFIVGYAGRRGRAGEALRRADRAKEYLVEKRNFNNPRLNTVDCGYREGPATELWITPTGAAPPLCAPTLKPNEVQVTGQDGGRLTTRPATKNRRRPGRR